MKTTFSSARSPRSLSEANLAISFVAGVLCVSSLGWLLAQPAQAADDRGWLGIYTEPAKVLPPLDTAQWERIGEDSLEDLLQGATCGLRVTAVFPFSPAEAGGLIIGDIIVAAGEARFDCSAAEAQNRFRNSLDSLTAGTPYPVTVIRNEVTRLVRYADVPGPDGRAFEGQGALDAEGARRFWRDPGSVIDSLESGESIEARAWKSQRVITLPVVLGLRPEASWPAARSNAVIYPPAQLAPSRFTPLVWELCDAFDLRAGTEDLLDRLAQCHEHADPFRLECMTYAHRDPFRLESLSRTITDSLGRPRTAINLLAAAAAYWVPEHRLAMPVARRLLVPGVPGLEPGVEPGLEPGVEPGLAPGRVPAGGGTMSRQERIRPLLDQISQVLGEARTWHRRAFAGLTGEERAFLEDQRWILTEVFAEEVYIHFDEDRDRFERNYRLIQIAEKIDYGALLEAALRVALLADPEWAMHAGRYVQEVYADTLETPLLLDQPSPAGRIVLGGRGSYWYRDEGVAFILDLGGDDVYTAGAGSGSAWETPLSVCIDLEGDDAYETTENGHQGCGCLGVGGLLDLEGNDQYTGMQWAQGTGYMGIGWLHDIAGDDRYRGRTFCQGVGLFGLGLLLDEEGDDRFTGDGHVQAVGLAKGIGLLRDVAGDDEYYAKGLYPTGYGTPGIFEAWSQGCGMGFRTLASGGLGALLDGGGRDRMEAGNFSQGGGYYYGYGLLHAGGVGDDTYIGSRYNQGFSAHQALGAFFEDGGDDFYTTRNGVVQGLAWDECVTLFLDQSGNDHYQGGRFFSHGASAHNSFCFFIDREGRDRYDYAPGPARAGGNDYHGGTSFSLFIDEGGDEDLYESSRAANDRAYRHPEHGFFLDHRETLERARPAQFQPTPD